MRQRSSYQGGGCLFTVSALGASPVGLNYYSLVLPSILLTAREDVTSDFLAGVIYDTAKRLKKASSYPPYHDILQYNNIHYTTVHLQFYFQHTHRLYVSHGTDNIMTQHDTGRTEILFGLFNICIWVSPFLVHDSPIEDTPLQCSFRGIFAEPPNYFIVTVAIPKPLW
jgi:hypothetical protein